jgi:hypothetical protein
MWRSDWVGGACLKFPSEDASPKLSTSALPSVENNAPWAWSSWLISMLKAQGSAQVRAATAPVPRRKWTLERSRFGADYFSNLRRYFFIFALDSVNQRRRSAQVTQSCSCSPFQWLIKIYLPPYYSIVRGTELAPIHSGSAPCTPLPETILLVFGVLILQLQVSLFKRLYLKVVTLKT